MYVWCNANYCFQAMLIRLNNNIYISISVISVRFPEWAEYNWCRVFQSMWFQSVHKPNLLCWLLFGQVCCTSQSVKRVDVWLLLRIPISFEQLDQSVTRDPSLSQAWLMKPPFPFFVISVSFLLDLLNLNAKSLNWVQFSSAVRKWSSLLIKAIKLLRLSSCGRECMP